MRTTLVSAAALVGTVAALAAAAVALSYAMDAVVRVGRRILRRPAPPPQTYVSFWMDHEPAPYKGNHRPPRRRSR